MGVEDYGKKVAIVLSLLDGLVNGVILATLRIALEQLFMEYLGYTLRLSVLFNRGTTIVIFKLLRVFQALAHQAQGVEELVLSLPSHLLGHATQFFALGDTCFDWVFFLVDWVYFILGKRDGCWRKTDALLGGAACS